MKEERREREKGRGREREKVIDSPFHSVISKSAFLSSFEFLIFVPVVGENNPEESIGRRAEIS